MFKNLFFFLFSHFSVGLVATIFFVSLQEIGKLFFRLNTSIAIFLLVAALWVRPFGDFDFGVFWSPDASRVETWQQMTYLLLGLSALSLLFYNIAHPRLHRVLLAASLIFGLAGVAYYTLAAQMPRLDARVWQGVVVVHGVTAALVLGSVLGAMITGHWYLVQHKLSMTPLRNSSRVYLISMVSRGLLVIATLVFYWQLNGDRLISLFTHLNFESAVFYFRLGFGLLLPVIFGFMVWSAVRIRSTQSATGILYATIVLVVIGEMFGRVLSMSIGLPL